MELIERKKRLFDKVCEGKISLTENNALQFLEGFYSQGDVVSCISKVITTNAGLSSLQNAMRVKLSPRFFNNQAATVLTYLQDQDLKIMNEGDLLRKVLMKIVDPPFFWDAYRESFLKHELDDHAQLSFSWLLLQLCSLPTDNAEKYRTIPEMQAIMDLLLASPSSAIKTSGQKIKRVLETFTPVTTLVAGPGGRHDNDFDDFRKISIDRKSVV